MRRDGEQGDAAHGSIREKKGARRRHEGGEAFPQERERDAVHHTGHYHPEADAALALAKNLVHVSVHGSTTPTDQRRRRLRGDRSR